MSVPGVRWVGSKASKQLPGLWQGQWSVYFEQIRGASIHVWLSNRSVDDVVLLSRALLGKPSALHDVPPVPFKEVSLPSKLKFGYYTSGSSIQLL
jgi:hypothetical protein